MTNKDLIIGKSYIVLKNTNHFREGEFIEYLGLDDNRYPKFKDSRSHEDPIYNRENEDISDTIKIVSRGHIKALTKIVTLTPYIKLCEDVDIVEILFNKEGYISLTYDRGKLVDSSYSKLLSVYGLGFYLPNRLEDALLYFNLDLPEGV